MQRLQELISEQQKGHETAPRYMIGEQLKEIAEKEPVSAELLERDLQIKEMSLEAAEKEFKRYADEHHGKENAFCIMPIVAEGILRKFYGLPSREENSEKSPAPKHEKRVELSDYL